MMRFKAESAAKLKKLLKQEVKFWEQLRGLTMVQAELLENDDIEALEASIDKRQSFIDQINGLHQESNVLMQSYLSFSDTKDGTIAEIDSLRAKIKEAVSACADRNEKNLVAAKLSKEGYVEKADELGQKRKTLGAYAGELTNNSELFDKKM